MREVAVHLGKSSYRYLGSLQLFVSRKIGGSRSLPQITLPARRGLIANAALRSRKYRLTARLHSLTDLVAVVNNSAGHPAEDRLYDIQKLCNRWGAAPARLAVRATLD
jgi:hypothetical protein